MDLLVRSKKIAKKNTKKPFIYVSPNKILTMPKLAYPSMRKKPEIITGFAWF